MIDEDSDWDDCGGSIEEDVEEVEDVEAVAAEEGGGSDEDEDGGGDREGKDDKDDMSQGSDDEEAEEEEEADDGLDANVQKMHAPDRLKGFLFASELQQIVGKRADMLSFGGPTTLPAHIFEQIEIKPHWALTVAIAEFACKRMPLHIKRKGGIIVDPNTAKCMIDPWIHKNMLQQRLWVRELVKNVAL